jgi:hypothetical protein
MKERVREVEARGWKQTEGKVRRTGSGSDATRLENGQARLTREDLPSRRPAAVRNHMSCSSVESVCAGQISFTVANTVLVGVRADRTDNVTW